jgi:hypothetical protein
VEVTTMREPFSHFLTKLCAIAGGVFAISTTIDTVIYQTGLFLGRNAGFLGGTPR